MTRIISYLRVLNRGSTYRRAWLTGLLCVVAGCAQDGRQNAQADDPPPPGTPPPIEDAMCWVAIAEIDDDLGCYSLSFDTYAGDLQAYKITLQYPQDLKFAGFSAIGPSGTPFGSLEIDVDFDGAPDFVVLFSSLGDELAYADILQDREFAPALEPSVEHGEGNFFRLTLPYGGDADPNSIYAPAGARITLRIRDELLIGDAIALQHFTVNGESVSVDPESGNHDDAQGAAPTVTQFTAEITRLK